MKHTIIIKDLEDIDRAAGQFLSEIGENKLIAFYAPMGAGKTTFTTALCRRLGVNEDAVSSPTFAIVNEYRTGNGEPMYHFDFYRITKTEEALDIGFYDYIDSGCLCIMEWPENIGDILPDETLHVTIEVNPDESRTISWEDNL
jgi:tRNA threonylcarbamoyladenosine biosynthesis protein TsaE